MDKEAQDAYRSQLRKMGYLYLSLGWSIIPMHLSQKKPAVTWKDYQTTPASEEQVESWLEDGVPDGHGGLTKIFGWAVLTGKISGLVVLDCDNQDAINYALGEASLFSLLSTRTTRGQHFYFRYPDGIARVQCQVGGSGAEWIAPHGVDLRADGGYVVAPPSIKFDGDGKFVHQYAYNCPDEEIENFSSSLPIWPGISKRVEPAPVPMGEWSFDSLNLSAVRTYGEGVWKQASDRVAGMGRKMHDGDGRNNWLVRYIGECISSSMSDVELRNASVQFQTEFFDPVLPIAESEAALTSLLAADKRNHPEKHAAIQVVREKQDKKRGVLRLIKPSTLGELKKMAGESGFLIDPYVPPNSIIQVVGFNGHGKSLWLLHTIWAASRGESFGSGYCTSKVRTLYLDFEGSITTLHERVDWCDQSMGPMSDELVIWNASAADDSMPLSEPDSVQRLQEMINEVKPQLVIIDTVRQAWSGMDENSPHSWVRVNELAMACRNAGMSVILVHHRNKPTMTGHGREAGSTAQLKDLDVQIIITKVVQDTEQAKREAAMPDAATFVADFAGNQTTAWAYLERTLTEDFKIKMVFEVAFGKTRKATDNNVTTYVGLAQSSSTGGWRTVHSLTPIQKVIALNRKGCSIEDISLKTGVSQPTVKSWVYKIGDKK